MTTVALYMAVLAQILDTAGQVEGKIYALAVHFT